MMIDGQTSLTVPMLLVADPPSLLQQTLQRPSLVATISYVPWASYASRYADELRGSDRECFGVILLSAKNHALGLHIASVGTVDASLVSPTIVFRPAVLANAVGVIAVHNHPSGDTCPSAEDLRVTRQLIEASRVMDVKLLDHVILGRADSVYSMREEGLVSFAA